MNWKKWIKYTGVTLLTLTIIATLFLYFGMKSSMKQFYGANTPIVDSKQFEPISGSFAIKNVNILNTNSDSFIVGQTVLIKDGIIQSIESATNISSETTVVDGSGKYLIPGLIDSHVHLFYSPNDLLLYIANGVTEIREMMGNKERLSWKKEIENGRIGPKMWVASPPLGTADNLEKRFISWTRQARNVNDKTDAEKAIQDFVNQGYDAVKIYSHLNKESYIAATQKAKGFDLPIVGHIPWEIELNDVWENGQSEIGHIEELMNGLKRAFGNINGRENEFLEYVVNESDRLAENLIKNDIAVTSTVGLVDGVYRQKFELDDVLTKVELSYANVGIVEGVAFGDSGFGWLPKTNLYRLPKGLTAEEIEGRKRFWAAYAKACEMLTTELSSKGVKIMAGTDANLPTTVPGFSLHEELIGLHKLGMTNAEVLRSVTSTPADWLGHKAGRITEGYDANLILLDMDPLSDIANTRTVNTVFSNGKMYSRLLLDEMLAAVKKANDSVRTIDISKYEL